MELLPSFVESPVAATFIMDTGSTAKLGVHNSPEAVEDRDVVVSSISCAVGSPLDSSGITEEPLEID
jgi:hypothetical protein